VTSDHHERARLLIALADTEKPDTERPGEEQSWLAGHLASCTPCREFAESVEETIRALHAVPVAADWGLVSATQMRVRQRARELRQRRERQWVMSVCCAAVTLSTVFTSVLLWFGFAWIGRQAQLSAPVWGTCYATFCLMPALLMGILLLSRGTHLADDN
jgi:predicted anti-sigma-YlaC factor YlaD